MVVGLVLREDVGVVLVISVNAGARLGEEAPDAPALDDRGVVLVGAERALGIGGVGLADHAEQRIGLRLAVNDPVGVKNLVAAVLGIGLREHHKFDVGGIAL